MILILVLNLLTCGWLAFMAVASARKLIGGERCTIHFVIIVHFFLMGLPLLFDVAFGLPEYAIFPGLRQAAQDGWTCVLYCAAVSVCPVLWWTWRKPRGRAPLESPAPLHLGPWQKRTALLLMVLPCLLLPFAPDPFLYLNYASHIGQSLADFDTGFQALMSTSIILSIVSAFVILLDRDKPGMLPSAGLLFFVAVDCWLLGKRSVVAISAFLLGYVLWIRGRLDGARLTAITIGGLLLMAGFSYLYQQNVRGIDAASMGREGVYENFRVDYGRDHMVKLSLYAQIHPDRVRILDYPCQSVFGSMTAAVPRKFWAGKPWPYAEYATSAAMLQNRTGEWGWGLTTSWLDEAISNFGWMGLLAGPLLFTILCRIGDASGARYVGLLTTLVSILFLTLNLSAFMVVALLWALAVFNARPREPLPPWVAATPRSSKSR